MVARRAIAAVVAVLPIFIAGALADWVYRRPSSAYVDFERGYEEGFISGFHGHEKMRGGRGFRWSTGDSRIKLENLPRQARLRVEVRIKGLRPKDVPLPRVRFSANGATVFETLCAPGLVTYRFGVTLPGNSLELGIHPDIFVPAHYGREDDRVLGVQVFSVSVEPQGGESGWTRPVGWMMLTAGLLLAAGLIAGLSLPVSSVIAIGLSVGSVYLLGQDSVRFMPPMLIAVLAGSLVFKLTGLFYPLLFSSDAEFHVNRLLEVLEGNFFTTSVTQHTPPFRIPYPVSLYVLAAPFAALTQDLAAVLKGLTAFADIAVGLRSFPGRRPCRDPGCRDLPARSCELPGVLVGKLHESLRRCGNRLVLGIVVVGPQGSMGIARRRPFLDLTAGIDVSLRVFSLWTGSLARLVGRHCLGGSGGTRRTSNETDRGRHGGQHRRRVCLLLGLCRALHQSVGAGAVS
jgi:hypothetical protein